MKKKLFLLMSPILLAVMLMVLSSTTVNAQISFRVRSLDNPHPIAVLTCYKVKKDYQQRFSEALYNYVLRARMSERNVMAAAYYEEQDPSILWVIERWGTRRQFERFSQNDRFSVVQRLTSVALLEPARVIYVKDLEPLSETEWNKMPAKEDDPITIMLFVDTKAGTEHIFKNVYHIAMPLFRTETGVIQYQLSQLEDDETQFVTYEKFRNEDAFQYHLQFPPIQPVIDYLNTSIKKPPFQNGLRYTAR